MGVAYQLSTTLFYSDEEGSMLYKIFLTTIFALSFLLAGCGKEGPFGDTPGPKKPIWGYDLAPMR